MLKIAAGVMLGIFGAIILLGLAVQSHSEDCDGIRAQVEWYQDRMRYDSSPLSHEEATAYYDAQRELEESCAP